MLEATLELPREPGLVAQEEAERIAVVCQFLEGRGEAQGLVEIVAVFGLQFRGEIAHLLVDDAAFGDPGALLPPAGDGHFLDEQALGGSGGLVLGEEGGVELVETVFAFVEEADGGGGEVGRGEAVARGFGGGAGLAFWGDWALGFFPVGARGGAAAFG